MRSYKTNEFHSDSPSVVALGCFDGVHIGHGAVISEAVSLAKRLSVRSAVWTFDEPPRNFFTPGASPIITDYDEKRRLMRSFGIDIFVSVPFEPETGELSPRDFFETVLVDKHYTGVEGVDLPFDILLVGNCILGSRHTKHLSKRLAYFAVADLTVGDGGKAVFLTARGIDYNSVILLQCEAVRRKVICLTVFLEADTDDLGTGVIILVNSLGRLGNGSILLDFLVDLIIDIVAIVHLE